MIAFGGLLGVLLIVTLSIATLLVAPCRLANLIAVSLALIVMFAPVIVLALSCMYSPIGAVPSMLRLPRFTFEMFDRSTAAPVSSVELMVKLVNVDWQLIFK